MKEIKNTVKIIKNDREVLSVNLDDKHIKKVIDKIMKELSKQTKDNYDDEDSDEIKPAKTYTRFGNMDRPDVSLRTYSISLKDSSPDNVDKFQLFTWKVKDTIHYLMLKISGKCIVNFAFGSIDQNRYVYDEDGEFVGFPNYYDENFLTEDMFKLLLDNADTSQNNVCITGFDVIVIEENYNVYDMLRKYRDKLCALSVYANNLKFPIQLDKLFVLGTIGKKVNQRYIKYTDSDNDNIYAVLSYQNNGEYIFSIYDYDFEILSSHSTRDIVEGRVNINKAIELIEQYPEKEFENKTFLTWKKFINEIKTEYDEKNKTLNRITF